MSPILDGQIYDSPRRILSPAGRDHSPSSDYSSEDEEYSESIPSSQSSSHSHRPSPKSSTTSPLSPVQKGLREARHFAGGIIHHPAESTDHYSILRHSHGLVFYQGTSTSIAISVFADRELPPDRSYLLKPKAWSFAAKNRATFKEQTSSLMNVTPSATVKVEQLNPSDERAWQRDIAEFKYRTRRGYKRKHTLRETVVVHIPVEAGDGYFQLALCHGKSEEMYCISPVFRLLSVSPTMGAISGAHWATLPLEIGAIALTMQAKTAIGTALLPVKLAAKSKTVPHMPGGVVAHAGHARTAGKLAYGATGAADRVATELAKFNESYIQEREGPFTPALKIDDDYEHGPKPPYPITFEARVDTSRRSKSKHIMPRRDLINISENVLYRLCGYYFGWCYLPSERVDRTGRIRHRSRWYQAIIVVIPIDIDGLDRVSMSRANQKHVQLQILDDHEQPSHDEVLKIQIFGCIRPWDQELEKTLAVDMKKGEEIAFETVMENEANDIVVAQAILDEPSWHPEVITEREAAEPKEKAHGMERVKQEYTEKRLAVQKKIDKVPLHKFGVRMPVDKRKDQTVITNGYFVER